MTKFIFKNQKLINQKQAKIAINHRGFLFGDGVFETCRIVNGKIYNFNAHYQRLNSGLNNLKIKAKISDLEQKSLKLIAKNKVKNGILRIAISRGVGSKGYLPSDNCQALTIISTKNKSTKPKIVNLGQSSHKTPLLNLGKTSNSLPYILTKIEAQEQGFFDSVMLCSNNNIAETGSCNIFWVKNGQIFTPSQDCSIIMGTIRQKLLQICPEITEIKANIDNLKEADEIFLTNVNFLILPVNNFLGKKLDHKITTKLAKILQEDIKKSCKK